MQQCSYAAMQLCSYASKQLLRRTWAPGDLRRWAVSSMTQVEQGGAVRRSVPGRGAGLAAGAHIGVGIWPTRPGAMAGQAYF